MAHKGVANDTVKAKANSGVAMRMCENYHMNTSMSFSAGAYTEEHAIGLGLVWVDKLHFLLGEWVESGCDIAFDLNAAMAAYIEPPQCAVIDGSGHARAQRRLQDVRAVRPLL